MVTKEKLLRDAGLPQSTPIVDKSIQDGYTWEGGVFTVPSDVSDERVQNKAPEYRNKFGEQLEKKGFRVLDMRGPHVIPQHVQALINPFRRKYRIVARVSRRPVDIKIDVPDSAVPALQGMGMKLVD